MNDQKTEYDAAFEAGVVASATKTIAGLDIPAAVIPLACKVESLERFEKYPARRRAAARFTTVESFTRYFETYKTDAAVIFADPSSNAVNAILDYHDTAGIPSWCEDKAALQLTLSLQWKTWTGNHNRPLTQVQFAEFLEDNYTDIVDPDGASVLETAMKLEAKKTVVFKSAVNLDNGAAQFTYEESVDGKGKGLLTVPTRFTLLLSIFEGGNPVQIPARLRYRIKEDKLTFTYLLERPERLLKSAFDEVLGEISQATGVQPFVGAVSTS